MQAREIAKKVFISNAKYLKNSYYGNPRVKVQIHFSDGTVQEGTTKTDATCGYCVRNYEGYKVGEKWQIPRYADIEYHTTKRGIIIDVIRDTTA